MVSINFTEQWQKMSFWNFCDANLKWVIHKNLAHWLKMLFDNCIDNSKSFEHLYSYEQQFSPVTESRIEIGIKIWWQLQLVADNCLFAVSTFHYIWPRMNQIFAGGIEPNWRVLNPNLHSDELTYEQRKKILRSFMFIKKFFSNDKMDKFKARLVVDGS